MTTPVPRQKINLPAAHLAANQRIGWRPEWSIDLMLGSIAQLFHLIQTAAANDADRRSLFAHLRSRLNRKGKVAQVSALTWRSFHSADAISASRLSKSFPSRAACSSSRKSRLAQPCRQNRLHKSDSIAINTGHASNSHPTIEQCRRSQAPSQSCRGG